MRGVRRRSWAVFLCAFAITEGCDDASVTLLRVLTPAAVAFPRQVEIYNGLEFARPDGKPLYFDFFRPFPHREPAPLIINIHGGGWYKGTRDQLVEFSYDFAANGYATAQIDYRLTGNGVYFPAPAADVLEAIRFFKSHADRYGIDPDRIALFGASAGGHLAMLTGMTNDTSRFDASRPSGETSGVKAIISLFAPTDLTIDPLPDYPELYSAMASLFGVPLGAAGDLRAAASPIRNVRANGPPILIIQGDADTLVPKEQSFEMVNALRLAGQPCVFLEIQGMDHMIGGLWYSEYGQRIRKSAFDFLVANL